MAKLIIQIELDDKLTRRELNNLLAHCNAEIHNFITNGSTNDLSNLMRMGIREYDLDVSIDLEKTNRQ